MMHVTHQTPPLHTGMSMSRHHMSIPSKALQRFNTDLHIGIRNDSIMSGDSRHERTAQGNRTKPVYSSGTSWKSGHNGFIGDNLNGRLLNEPVPPRGTPVMTSPSASPVNPNMRYYTNTYSNRGGSHVSPVLNTSILRTSNDTAVNYHSKLRAASETKTGSPNGVRQVPTVGYYRKPVSQNRSGVV